ncbi:alpha/beta fold hydrolase [Roseobacter sp. MH60115]|uniref:alpha/beta fold hydrolase n=1 Tax=Roseobacter sp. MH60115 TaxID=2785324 RepID=UPI0018A26E3D|nr:alpha/beta fold hydrolase [Roseobacter sp. MH60115]
MTLFFSRRTYNASKQRFTNNPADVTRYVRLTSGPDASGKWTGGIISKDDWLAHVKAEAATNEITIYVHGFNTDQIDNLNRMNKIRAGLNGEGYRGALIAYDWPSAGTVTAYDSDKRHAKLTAEHLVRDGILPLLALSPRPKVNLIAHSMGAYLVLRALSEFDDDAGPGSGAWKLNETLFVSGDADRRWFGKGAWGALLLAHRSKRFTNYYSQLDDVLNAAVPANGFRKRAGRSGMPSGIHKNHVDLYSHEQYLKDVDGPNRTVLNSHRWWFDNAKFYRDAGLTLAGQPAFPLPTRRRTTTTDLALLS